LSESMQAALFVMAAPAGAELASLPVTEWTGFTLRRSHRGNHFCPQSGLVEPSGMALAFSSCTLQDLLFARRNVMSQTQLLRNRKHRPCVGVPRQPLTGLRGQSDTQPQAESMLREMAFVLQATRRVREAITGEKT
jgi:hypothetical protein